MNVGKTVTAIGLEQDRLCAVCATVGPDRVTVRAGLVDSVPASVDARDAKALGTWIGQELDRRGFPRTRVVFALARGDVVLKRLSFPRPEQSNEGDLAGMVRLQMARQLTMAVDGSAIDYVPIEGGGPAGTPGPAPTISLMAGALPGDRLEWFRDVAEAMGRRIDRIGLRASGVAALLAGASQRHAGPLLGVALGLGSVEFVVVDEGQLVFARSADLGAPTPDAGEPDPAFVQRVAVEAKRTWMAFRVGQEATEVDGLAVPGEGPLAREIAARCGEALEMPFELVAIPTAVEMPRAMSAEERLLLGPLVGLLAEPVLGRAMLDFCHPRRAPDRAAIRRQRVLLGVLALILLSGAGYLGADARLNTLRTELGKARARADALDREYTDHLLQDARLRHLEQWIKAQPDWLGHLRWISDQMPDPRLLQLDVFSGDLSAGIAFTPARVEAGKEPETSYTDGKWALQTRMHFALTGKVTEREVANELRTRLVNSQLYKVDSKGADVPDRFSFDLDTSALSPTGGASPAAPAEVSR